MRLLIADCRLLIGVGVLAVVLAATVSPGAQQRQTAQDEYAVYELLAPETASFKILYDVLMKAKKLVTGRP